MAKMSELDRCVKELRTAAESLVAAADSLTDFYSGKSPPTAPKSENAVGLNEPETAPITLDVIRAVLATKAQEGHREKVKALIAKHGGETLSAVPESNYAALKAEAEALT